MQVPLRSEIAPEYTWNAPSVFESIQAWETEFDRATAAIPDITRFKRHLGDGPVTLADALDKIDEHIRRVGALYMYALMSHQVDMNDQVAAGMAGKAQSLFGQSMAAISFMDPELLTIGRDQLESWVAKEPRLGYLSHYIDNLFRKQAHVRSAEVEELLGMLIDPFGGPMATADFMTDGDFKFAPAVDSAGNEQPVTQGTLSKILASADREARRTAWEHYSDTYLAFKNTLASNLTTSIKQNTFLSRARRHDSTLEAALFEDNIPVEVFENLIDTFRKNLPTWHRYWELKRRALGVETLHPYDVWAPLTQGGPAVSFEQAVTWICEGLAPMGQAYVDTVRKGCLEQRWVDVYPNQGKSAGAFSAGWPGTYPFILMSFNDNILSLSTLAHELGHSMHSFLTWEKQPTIYSQYSLFVAEVASNFHQALVREYLFENQPDPVFQIGLIEEAMSNFHRYFFIMPTLARFELEVHQRIEQGQGVTADDLINLMADLFGEGYGDKMHIDRSRVGITWATFSHLYVDYYVYQYATGISGAHALSHRVLSGEENAVEDYLNFLQAGGSLYPLDALKTAGVDLRTPEAVEVTFDILARMVDKLETLLAQLDHAPA